MSLQNRLILFFFVTSLGSALSSIATFLSIESYFKSLILLGLALSVRTLASAVFSYFSNHIIQSLGLRYSLIMSQVFGCLSLVVLYLGFQFDIFIVTIIGIILTGLPSTFVAILISIILRVSSENSELFRKYSGRRELVFGIAMLLSSMLAPILLWKLNLNWVLLIDATSYLIGIGILTNLKIEGHIPEEEKKTKPVSLSHLLLTSKNAQSFMIKTSASLLLAGLLPLLASSSHIQFTMTMPILLRQWLWSIEDITAISASLIYLLFAMLRKQKFFEPVVMLSSIWLIIPLVFQHNYNIIFSVVVICLLTDFSGQKFRDDLIISAGNDVGLIKASSALSLLQRNFIFFLSPILLSLLFNYTTLVVSVGILFIIQILFYFINRFLMKG